MPIKAVELPTGRHQRQLQLMTVSVTQCIQHVVCVSTQMAWIGFDPQSGQIICIRIISIHAIRFKYPGRKDSLTVFSTTVASKVTTLSWYQNTFTFLFIYTTLECGPMPNVMVTLSNIGGALCSTPQNLADAHY